VEELGDSEDLQNFFSGAGIKSKTLCLLGRHSTMELHPSHS
jgi:hypothetical protein